VPPPPGSSQVTVVPVEQNPDPDEPLIVNVRNTPAGSGVLDEPDVTIAVTAMLSAHGGVTQAMSSLPQAATMIATATVRGIRGIIC
jgi:hypothetical protein